MPTVGVGAIEDHWHGAFCTDRQSLHTWWHGANARSSFSGMGGDIVKQMSDQTGQMLGGPPRKDLKDEKIFSDEQSEGMEKLQQMDRDKIKRMEEREEELKEAVQKEKEAVADYENRKKDLQEEVEDMEEESKHVRMEGGPEARTDDHPDDGPEDDGDGPGPADEQHEFMESSKPEDEIPVAVATTQDQWRRQRIAKDQIQVAQDQMQLAKDTQVLAEGQDKLTNLRTPGVAKEELLAEQVRDQKRIALDQELLVQSQKRLAEDMDNAVDGKLRWERLEDYRKQRIEQFQDMVNEKLDRLYKEEIDFVKRNRKGKLRGAPIDVPQFGPIGVRIVSGQKAALATGGEDGSEVLNEPNKECVEDVAEREAEDANDANDAGAEPAPVVHSGLGAAMALMALVAPRLRSRSWDFFPELGG